MGMMKAASQYVTISAVEMHSLLMSAKGNPFEEIKIMGTTETVYDRVHESFPNIVIRVYTSIQNGQSRGYGSDAIRVILFDKAKNKAIGRETRTHRTTGWNERLKTKIREVYLAVKNIPHCPCCQSYMAIRKGTNGEFWGCTDYPNCKGTRKVEN